MGAHGSRRVPEVGAQGGGLSAEAGGAARHADAPPRAETPAARSRGLHGRRKGKPLRSHQAGLVETLLPRLALPLEPKLRAGERAGSFPTDDDGPRPPRPIPDPRTLFPHSPEAVNVEIGFGGGEHLAAEAEANPRLGFIGCEPFLNGMAKLLAAVETQGLANLRVHGGDGLDLLRALPTASIARVDLLYPDPWPKARQRKRRFVSAESLSEIARVLVPGGLFRFASDIDDYAAWTLSRLLAEPGLEWTARVADDFRRPWPGYAPTRYEAKARAEGRGSTYVVARRRG